MRILLDSQSDSTLQTAGNGHNGLWAGVGRSGVVCDCSRILACEQRQLGANWKKDCTGGLRRYRKMNQFMHAEAQRKTKNWMPIAGVLQSRCDKCKGKDLLQRSATGPEPESVPPIVHEVLRSPGQPLDAAT